MFSLFPLWNAAAQGRPHNHPPATDETTKPTNSSSAVPAQGLRIGTMKGGTGGKGGTASDGATEEGKGGRGGQGGEALINHHRESSNMIIDELEGGTGGEGGTGTIAGDGGGGGKAVIKGEEETLLSKSRLPGPEMTIQEFGAKFSLSKKIVAQLSDCEYDTVGSLRFATVTELKADSFKQGQINQLKHALDIWSPK